MLFKTLNFTNKVKKKGTWGAGSAQLIKSLKHSLRIPSKSSKDKLEWIEDQSFKNLIWTPNNGLQKLDDLTRKEKASIALGIVKGAKEPVQSNDSRTALSKLRTKLKDKVKSASKTETDEGLISAFQDILNVKGTADIEMLIAQLEQYEFKRKSQKIPSARKFLECHNAIHAMGKQKISKTNATVQEAFFKFPSANEVTGLKPEERLNVLKGFFDKYFENYPVHFVVLHGDEDPDCKDYSDHPHIFISTKNEKTGNYDLFNSQIKLVNRYLAKIHPDVKQISDKPDFAEARVMYGYLQDIFYLHINNKLLKSLDYQAEKIEKTEEHMQKLRNIRKEQYLPKEERHFNLHELVKKRIVEANNHALIIENQNNELENKKAKLTADLIAVQNATNGALNLEKEANQTLVNTQRLLKEASLKLTEVQKETSSLNEALPPLRKEKIDLKSDNTCLTETNTDLQRKNNDLEPFAKKYDELVEKHSALEQYYNETKTKIFELIRDAQSDLFKGVKKLLAKMWSLEYQSNGKLEFKRNLIGGKIKIVGKPDDVNSFQDQAQAIAKESSCEAIDLFNNFEFLWQDENAHRAYRQEVLKNLNKQLDAPRRPLAHQVDKYVKDVKSELVKHKIEPIIKDESKPKTKTETEKYFDDADTDAGIKEYARKNKPKI